LKRTLQKAKELGFTDMMPIQQGSLVASIVDEVRSHVLNTEGVRA